MDVIAYGEIIDLMVDLRIEVWVNLGTECELNLGILVLGNLYVGIDMINDILGITVINDFSEILEIFVVVL